MQNFEKYAQKVTEGLNISNSMKERIHQEVVAHLEDEMQRCLSEGLTHDEAHNTALERFGNEQTIHQLVAQALKLKEARFRRLCTICGINFTVVLVLIAIGIGAWLTVFNDAVAGRDFYNSMPKIAWFIMYFGAGIGCLVILTIIISKLFRVSMLLAGLCTIILIVIFYISIFLFDSIPLIRETIGTIRSGQSSQIRVVNSFLMRLYLCWVPTVIAGVIIAIFAKRRNCILWLSVSFGIGLISAFLWGFNSIARPAPWMYWMKWPKLLSTGLLVLLFVLLTGFLARTVAERFGWGDFHKTNIVNSNVSSLQK